MSVRFTKVRRLVYGALALATVAAVGVPALSGRVSAAGQVTSRSIKLSNATLSATNTTYHVTFSWATTGNVQGIVVDFCDDSPIIASATCTLPGGFTLTATPGVSGQTSTAGGNITTFTTVTPLNSNRTLALTAASAVSMTAGVSSSFDITTVTNPNSANHSFYARIYTYATAAAATGYTVAAPGAYVDYGGVALSTADVINISATVQEQLTFCVSKAAPGAACSGTSTPNIVLGSGSPVVLSTTLATDTVYHQVTTNAVSGVSVALKNTSSTTCAGLSRDGGATCPIAGAGASAITINNGDGKFGLAVANGTGGTGTVSAVAPYNGSSQYAMTNGSFGTYGDVISSSTGAVTNVNSLMTYAAAAAATTPAGVYSAKHSLIATGTF